MHSSLFFRLRRWHFLTERMRVLCMSLGIVLFYSSHSRFLRQVSRKWVDRGVVRSSGMKEAKMADALSHSLEPGRGEKTPCGEIGWRDGGGEEQRAGKQTNNFFSFINLFVITVRRQRTVYEPGDLFLFFFLFLFSFLFFRRKPAILTPSLRARPLVCAAAAVGEMKINSGGSSAEMRHRV